MGNFNFSIDLPVRSEWSNVDLLRTSVQNCFTAIFSDIEGCHALAMVTGELIENPVKDGDHNAQEVLRTLGWMREFASPFDAYRAKLLEIAEAVRAPSDSRL